MDPIVNDIRHAFRGLVRRPNATGAAVITLGIGLGAVTTIFGVVNGVLLHPMSFQEPEALFFLNEQSDPETVGDSVVMAGQPWTVVGVLPQGFTFLPPSPRFDYLKSDFWVPIGSVSGYWAQHRDLHPGINVNGRVKADAFESEQ